MATATTTPRSAAEAEQRFFARFGPQGCADVRAVETVLGRAIARPGTVDEWIALGHELSARLAPLPPATAVAPPAGPRTLAGIAGDLARPFELYQVELKPGALTREKNRALALPYVDLRAYQDRLDEVAGIDGWSVEYRQLGERAIICRLTILGHVREDVGEPSEDGSNPATEALAQAFKRACSAFGLGRYLYSLPRLWADYDADRKGFVDPEKAARGIYAKAGLLTTAAASGRSGGR